MSKEPIADLLIAGGSDDPNLKSITQYATMAGLSIVECLHSRESEPSLYWEMQSSSLYLNGDAINVRAAFVRYDVFTQSSVAQNEDNLDRSLGWYTAIAGWLSSASSVNLFNRRQHVDTANKISILVKADQFGIPVPETKITNMRSRIDKTNVVKPVGGGAYCLPAEQLIENTEWRTDTAPMPAFVQTRLSYPEYRVFVIGTETICFEVTSASLDHRSNRSSSTVFLTEYPEHLRTILPKLINFAGSLGLDFCAFDLKIDKRNQCVMLEVNSSPMFAAFDVISNGALITQMLQWLKTDHE